jgi:hypothetical protein
LLPMRLNPICRPSKINRKPSNFPKVCAKRVRAQVRGLFWRHVIPQNESDDLPIAVEL